MDYDGFNERMYNIKTEFEDTFPKRFVAKVKSSYLTGQHCITFKDVIEVCRKKKITYSKYQQMESKFLTKLNRKF